MTFGRSQLAFLLRRAGNQLWVRAALYGVAGIITALIAAVLGPSLSFGKAEWLGSNAVKDLLTILASSMLAVATFSLSTMVAAFAAASSSATPRASALLIEDRTAQSALATFIGAFVFSIVGLIALSTGIYGPEGRVMMFGVTVVVIGLVVLTLMRWVDQLGRFGRVGETILSVERATAAAMSGCEAFLRGRSPSEWQRLPADARVIRSACIGYVQHIDLVRLQKISAVASIDIDVTVLPGRFVNLECALARLGGTPNDEQQHAVRDAFTIGNTRTYEQDPRFGMVVLAEIASRALSPAVNDPGTAIQVLHSQARLLQQWIAVRSATPPKADEPAAHGVLWKQISVDDLLVDAFRPIARDGAGMVEVGQHLLRVLGQLAHADDPVLSAAARVHAASALQRFEAGLCFDADLRALQESHSRFIGS